MLRLGAFPKAVYYNSMSFVTDIVSSYVHEARISAIKQMAMLSAKVEGAASLTWGLPSFRTPDYIREGVKTRLDQDLDAGKYTLPDGLPELRKLAVEKHLADTGIEVSASDNVMISAGNMQALNTEQSPLRFKDVVMVRRSLLP